ncbi:uncharacterized protein BDV17DRAFT_260288 [Aspergillus undulatus]|uniref:uncharacterized protein n=1 Tax=Aspergillus undulatus TaxID=1810928 RepID=UPI003CCCD565
MQVISTLAPMALMAAVGIAAPAPTGGNTGNAVDEARDFIPVKLLGETVNGHSNGHKEASGVDDIIINAPWTVSLHHLHPRPPRDLKDRDHLDCDSDEDCLFGTFCYKGRCTEASPVNVGGWGPPVPPPDEYLHPSSSVPGFVNPVPFSTGHPVHHGGVLDHLNGGLCKENADCGVGSFCINHKCTVARRVEKDTIPLPGDTYGNVCKEPGDCSPGSFCFNHHCTLARDIPGTPSTYGNVCKEPGDCSPGSFCVDQHCTFARGAEIKAQVEAEAAATHSMKKKDTTPPTPGSQEEFQAPCEEHSDCNTGSFCVDKHCTFSRGVEVETGTETQSTHDVSEYQGPCNTHSDCKSGSLCVAQFCTAATKLPDGSVYLAARDVVHEDDNFWYLESRAAVDVLDTLTGKTESVKSKNACPKKCGNGKHCCSNMFCQKPDCLGNW